MGFRKSTSWTCCVPIPKPHEDPDGAPTFFIDRDLGRKAFPEGLRQAGLRVVTLAEHYGIPRDQEVADHEWMLEAAGRGWPTLGCDAKHRRRRHSSIESIPIASSDFHSNDTSQRRRSRAGHYEYEYLRVASPG
jgi:hypothetical protein